MNKVLIFGLIFFVMVIQSCGSKEKQEESSTTIDSVIVKSNGVDTTAILTEKDELENIKEEVKQVQKEEIAKPVTKSPVVTKSIEKEVIKTTTEKKPEIKTEELVKKEVVVEKIVEKAVETKKEAAVVVEETKTIVNTSNWVVPTKDKNLKNPTADNKENIAIGKELYSLHCKACHGSKGLGDGAKAKSMKGDLGDFSSVVFQSQTDGELFYKTKVGRADMPSFTKKLSDEDIWLIVHFMRTLKK
ncbi:MAG: c-type cytochrome [Flavobacteriaceae bacterium]|nr:c-type cytochrome [Flavobacteriaceae bacterium]